jgi:DNA invertase Pin-like site-specific DNA recombinase
MKAFGYVRLSKETIGTTSPQRQRERIEGLCADRGWELVQTFEDIDVSAFNGRHRPAFTKMMGRLGEVDALVFWKLDRLSRSSVEAGQIAETAKAANVDLVATDMNIDTTSAGGKFVYTVLAAAGEMEAATTSERSRAMMRYKRERNEWVGRVPFGWRLEGKQLVPDPEQQTVLLEAAKRYAAGETFSTVARDLGFNVAPLIRMLRSERVQDALPAKVRDALVTALAERSLDRVPTSSQSLLGGIATCAICGGSMTLSSTRGGREGRWAQYRCSTAGHVGISAPWLDDHVTAQVIGAIDTGKLLDAIRRRRARTPSQKASEIEARIELLDEMFTAGKIAKARYERSNAQLVDQLVLARSAEADAGIDIPADLARNLAERWDQLTISARRRIIRVVLERVEVAKASGHAAVDPRRVSLAWRKT